MNKSITELHERGELRHGVNGRGAGRFTAVARVDYFISSRPVRRATRDHAKRGAQWLDAALPIVCAAGVTNHDDRTKMHNLLPAAARSATSDIPQRRLHTQRRARAAAKKDLVKRAAQTNERAAVDTSIPRTWAEAPCEIRPTDA